MRAYRHFVRMSDVRWKHENLHIKRSSSEHNIGNISVFVRKMLFFSLERSFVCVCVYF